MGTHTRVSHTSPLYGVLNSRVTTAIQKDVGSALANGRALPRVTFAEGAALHAGKKLLMFRRLLGLFVARKSGLCLEKHTAVASDAGDDFLVTKRVPTAKREARPFQLCQPLSRGTGMPRELSGASIGCSSSSVTSGSAAVVSPPHSAESKSTSAACGPGTENETSAPTIGQNFLRSVFFVFRAASLLVPWIAFVVLRTTLTGREAGPCSELDAASSRTSYGDPMKTPLVLTFSATGCTTRPRHQAETVPIRYGSHAREPVLTYGVNSIMYEDALFFPRLVCCFSS